MTAFYKIENTFMTNPGGIIVSVLPFGLRDTIKRGSLVYLYKYSLYDLVEILYDDDIIRVYNFRPDNVEKINYIRDNLEFLAGYFKSANLYGKRFLFNLSLRLPVTYEDFETVDSIPNLQQNDEFAFVLERGESYICKPEIVKVFQTTQKGRIIDKCVFSLLVTARFVANPSALKFSSCSTTAIISGLLSGIELDSFLTTPLVFEQKFKFIDCLRDFDFVSTVAIDLSKKLKTKKYLRIVGKKTTGHEKAISAGEVNLMDIVMIGLDKFMRALDGHDVINVCVDCEFQTIRSAYIKDGILHITPATIMPLIYFKELVSSENVVFDLN